MTASGIPRSFEVKDIVKVTFGAEPDALRAAREKVLAGDYEAAQAQLAKIDMAKVTTEPVKQDIDFYQALCMAKLALGEQAEKPKAASLMFKFKKENPNSYHFFEAVQVLGDLSVALGRFDMASGFYGELAKAPWQEYQLKAVILESHSLMAAGKYPEALAKFEQVINSSLTVGEITEQKMYATVGKAQCLAATGKADAGIKLLEEIIAGQDSSDGKLFGRTYNALGACYAKAGKPKDAVLAYLHTDLLFNSDADAHAESLYYLSKLWGDINQPDRGKRARDTLQNSYPTSRWAQMK
jgi:tetratricopeptide (TPR) repeat protein